MATGEKEFNPKTDTVLFDSFFGAKSNFDARQFSEVEKQIKELARELNSVKDNPDAYMRFVEKNPNAEAAIEFYDKGVGSDLRDLRAEANIIRRDRLFNPKDKKELLNNNTQMSNLVKRNMLMNLETLGYTP